MDNSDFFLGFAARAHTKNELEIARFVLVKNTKIRWQRPAVHLFRKVD